MKKGNICFKIGLIILMVGFLVTVSSCSEKKPRLDPMEQYPSETEVGTEVEQGGADQSPGLTEEELNAQRES